MKPKGIPKNIPSNLSKTPPCPGKKLPASLTFAFLFKKEKNKSPNWQKTEVSNPTRKIFILVVLVK